MKIIELSAGEREAARDHDYQVWIERVGDGDGIGVVIEDGAVAS